VPEGIRFVPISQFTQISILEHEVDKQDKLDIKLFSIQINSILLNPILFYSKKSNFIQFYSIELYFIKSNVIQFNSIKSNVIPFNSIKSNFILFYSIQFNSIPGFAQAQ
jgi:hypothetical protein